MSDENQVQAEGAAAPEATEPKPDFTLVTVTREDGSTYVTLDVDRMFFPAGSEGLTRAVNYATAVANYGDSKGEVDEDGNQIGVPVVQSEKPDWPENMGAAVLPLTKRIEVRNAQGEASKVTKLYGAMLWPFPDYDAIMAHPSGPDVVRNLVAANMAQNVLNPLRRQNFDRFNEDGSLDIDLSSVPWTIEDFLERTDTGDRSIYKGYNEAVKEVLKTLKAKSDAFKYLTPQLVRQFMESKAMAEASFPQLEAKGFWVGLLDTMQTMAANAGHPVEIFDTWKATRDETVVGADLDDLDLADLSFGDPDPANMTQQPAEVDQSAAVDHGTEG